MNKIVYTGSNQNVMEVYNFLTGDSVESNMDVKTCGEHFRVDFCNGPCCRGNLIIKAPDGEKIVPIGGTIIKTENGFNVIQS